MRLDVYPKFSKLIDSRVSGRTVIVVDVLRSTTSIIWAVKNGAGKIIPATDAGEAATIFSRLDSPDVVLAGEVGGVKHPDFHIGNSPFEFTPEVVENKTIIISTSNGTKVINGAKGAKSVLVGAMINMTAVAKRAAKCSDDILIICAGTDDEISADDLCAAGAIIDALHKNYDGGIEQSDMAFVCQNLYKNWENGNIDLSKTKHWSCLVELGYQNDIKFCFSKDVTDVVPEYNNGVIE
ncbi:MAG: 2-phosphosulfolactate phosphatase [Clostridiales bacterium]|jgi:2-phosphosulfolactate phosphatase|nr:2-phosphosulfolactate phosphatase [Clostridiales bacterium]